MKKITTKLSNALLFLGILFPLISSCNNNNNSDTEAYYSSMMVSYNGDGSYKGQFSLPEDSDDKFISISKDDFTLSIYDGSSTSASATLNDFTISKTDDKSFDLNFSSPFEYNESLHYFLESEKAVTEKGHKLSAFVYVSSPEVDLDVTYTGAYRGSNKITLTISLNEGWKFVSELKDEMLLFPDGMDLSIDVTRESDNKAIFVISDIPTDFSGTSIDFTLQKSAIDSIFANDIYLNIEFTQVELNIDQSSISYDGTTNILTVGKVYLPQTAKGKDGGISLCNLICEIKEQNYNSSENYYSFKIGFNEDYDKIAETSEYYREIDKESFVYNLNIDALVLVGNDEISYSFSPISVISGIKSNVITDEDNQLVTIELLPINASFKEDANTSSLIKISGNENLNNFKCASISKDKIIYTADYTSDLTNGVVLSFNVDGSILDATLKSDTYSFSTYISPFLGDKYIDWTDIQDELVKSAAKDLGKAIFSSVSSYVLPYIYEFLNVNNKNPDIENIQESVTNLSCAINDFSNDLNNLSSDILTSTNKIILDNFQTVQTTLLSSSLALLKDEDVINYVKYLQETAGRIYDSESGRVTYQKFLEYYYEAHGGAENACCRGELGAIPFYNACVRFAKYGHSTFSSFAKGCPEFTCYNSTDNDGCRTMDVDKVYEIIKGAKEYDPKLIGEIPVITRDEKFVSAFEKYNLNNAYISNVVNLGTRIVSNASGTSDGIIDLFFSVVDSMYNFESQTITIKRSFVSKLQSIYLVSAAMAIQYCDATNDTGNAAIIRNNVETACQKFDTAFNKIAEYETRDDRGTDRILVSNQFVSKQLKTSKISDRVKTTGTFDEFKNTEDVYYVSMDTLRTMVSRAKKRGISLANDLNKAGFKNITAAYGDTYAFLSSSMKWEDSNERFGFCGYYFSYKNYVMKGNFVVQQGNGDAQSYRNYEILSCYMEGGQYQKVKYIVKLNGGFNYLLSFTSPKK